MTSLPTAVKLHILTALACFDTPSEVAIAVKEKYGLQISRQRIEGWHPERVAGARLTAAWRDLFYATRADFLAEMESIPIAHRAFRLRGLGRIAHQAESMRNLPLVASIYEQAAKEVGGAYERAR
jgi:hypothetical protein